VRFAICVVGALVVVFDAAAPVLASVKPSSESVAAAVRAQGAFHYTYVQRPVGGDVIRMVGDAAIGSGIQRITFSKDGHTGHVTTIVLSNTAYVRGDAFTLHNFPSLAAPAAIADKDSGKWLKIDHSNRGFATVAGGVRLDSSWLRELQMPSSTRSAGTTTVDGQRVVRLQTTFRYGPATGTRTLYVRAAGKPLPVEQTTVFKGKMINDVHYSKWGETLHIVTIRTSLKLAP